MTISESDMFNTQTFKYAIEGIFMTTVLIFGLIGNSLSIYILRDKEVRLQQILIEVLCSLSVFDNLFLVGAFLLFSLPHLCTPYAEYDFQLIAPYLYPITNTLLTCSSYMTVAVAVNRYILVKQLNSPETKKYFCNGYYQAVVVLLTAICVNIPRWFEFSCCKTKVINSDIANELSDGLIKTNTTKIYSVINPIRDQYEYIRDYTLISSNVLTLLLPMILMAIFSGLVYLEMRKSSAFFTRPLDDGELDGQEKRNNSLTFMLIGIIILFIICRIGELGISVFELIMIIREGNRKAFPDYIRAMISINTLLLVCNSSFNFIIYNRDALFRKCFLRLYYLMASALRKKELRIQEHEEITLQDIKA